MKRCFLNAAVAAICFSFFGCHGDDTTAHVAIVKDIDSVDINSNDCSVTVCGTVQLAAREHLFLSTTVQVFVGTDGMLMDDLLSDLESFLVEEVILEPTDADEDGCIDVCVTVALPPGTLPVAVRAVAGSTISGIIPIGLVSGLPASPVESLSCRVVGFDAVLSWTLGTPLPQAEGGIVVLMDGDVIQTLAGDATGTTLPGIPAGATVAVRTFNKYGSSGVVKCVVARPGTPRLVCSLDNDKIVLTWESEALSVELFENGESLGVQDPNGSLELCDRNPGDYTFTAIGTGLEDQPEAVSDTATCELHRKARLILTECIEVDDEEPEIDQVLRVLLDGSEVPTLVNAKVLTLSLGETVLDEGLSVEADSRGSCSFFDVFFDVEVPDTDDRGEFETEILSLSLNGVQQEIESEDGEGELDGEFRIDEPGTVEILLVVQGTREVLVDTNEGEPNGDTFETEIVQLSLTGTAQIVQTATPLFGVGDESLGIADSRYADLYLEEASNVGNRFFMRPEIVSGYGFGYGYGSGWNHIETSGPVHGSAYGWFYDSFSASGWTSTIRDRHFFHSHYSRYPVWVHGSVSGPVYSSVYGTANTSGWNYIRVEVRTNVHVYVPVLIEDDIPAELVGYLAGFNALNDPDCVGFGIGREAGHLSLGFCDNIIVDGPGFDVRIFERSTPDATESFFLHTYLNKFFNINADTYTGTAPTWGSEFNLPVDQDVPTVSLGLGYRVIERDDCDGYIVDIDLATLGIDCLNMTRFVSDGEGNSIEGTLRDLFAGAEIDAVCGVYNVFGLPVEPVRCNEDDEPTRDLFVDGLFLDGNDEYEQEREYIWKYDLCGQVFCDGIKGAALDTNTVRVESYLAPYYLRHYLKEESLFGLQEAAEEAGQPFGLDIDY